MATAGETTIGYTPDYYLGCPSWGLKDWVGNLYPRGAKARDFLGHYATVFNTVEGNTTFYSLPSAESVERWRDATPASFRFCFKLPRTVTHEKALEGAGRDTNVFLDRLRPLGERLGPFMVQLPPAFGPDRLPTLGRFLADLPSDLRFAVEVRHRHFYDPGDEHDDSRRQLHDLLAHFACERVVMDTRALRAGDPVNEAVVAARRRKPDLPAEPIALGPHPMVRFVGHPDEAVDQPWLEHWADVVAGWLAEGRRPYFFAHCPDDLHAPPMARRFHHLLAERHEVGPMPPWPGEAEVPGEQLSLF